MTQVETLGLFGELPIPEAAEAARVQGAVPARVQWPNRLQMELRPTDLEGLLPEDHKARIVWGYVERQDLSLLYARIKAVEGGAGRAPMAPEILLSLWLYATLEGVGSARALARLCEAHDAYRWLCGGVGVNHHTLSDFRVGCGEFLDRLLTANVAALRKLWRGDDGAGGAGRHAGACRRRRSVVPAQGAAAGRPGPGPGAGGDAQARDRGRPGRDESPAAGGTGSGPHGSGSSGSPKRWRGCRRWSRSRRPTASLSQRRAPRRRMPMPP